MEDAKVCRICLIMGVKMYDVESYPLATYYDSVIGINNSPYHISLPSHLCYECAAVVKKFHFFKQKSLRSQDVLYGITDQFGKWSPEDIKSIDRFGLQIASSLQTKNIPEVTATIQFDYEIKIEPTEGLDYPEDCTEDSIKAENYDFETVPVEYPGLSSDDDDEPLSLQKEKKIKGKSKKYEKEVEQKESNGGLNDDYNQVSEDFSDLIVLRKEKHKSGKKRGRPKKGEVKAVKTRKPRASNTSLFSEDLNDMDEYITVITLSVEEQIEEINKRKQSSNYLNSPYQCNLCFKGFIDTDAWKHHVSKHSPSAGDIECQICKFRFKTKRALQKHASNHEKKFACKTCPYISTNTTQAKQHQGWHKGITFKCKHCAEIFTVWTSYMSHVRIKHPSEFICGSCGYSFVSKLGLAMHRTMMHKDAQEKSEDSKEEGPYCAECDVKFDSMEAYKRHVVMSVKHTETTDSMKGCRTCGEKFKTSEELRLHHRKEHTRKRPKNYGKKPLAHLANTVWPINCEHCSEEIPNAREYWMHFRRSHPDKKYPVQKDYVCDICGKSFRGNAFLTYHKRTHTEERSYKCSQCDKAFYNRANLYVHEKTHSEDRPYPCSVCFKAFKGKGALDRHFRCHTGHKPYECEVCGKAFTQSNSRKIHVRTVHLKQPAPYVSRNRQDKRHNKLLVNKEQPCYISASPLM